MSNVPTSSPPPYLISLAARAFVQQPRVWKETLKKVRFQHIEALPQTSIVQLQPALARAHNRNSNFKNTSSEKLLEEFQKRTNTYFQSTIVADTNATMKFILRLGCVLMRMKLLDSDPSIQKIIWDTGCIDPIMKNINAMTNQDIQDIVRKMQNMNRTFKDIKIIEEVDRIFEDMIPTQINKFEALAVQLLNVMMIIYNTEYRLVGGTSDGKMASEMFLLFEPGGDGKKLFEDTLLYSTLRSQLTNVTTQNITTLMASKTNGSKPLVNALRENVNHIKTMIAFYKKFDSAKNRNNALRVIVNALNKFESKAAGNSGYASGQYLSTKRGLTIDISRELSKKLGEKRYGFYNERLVRPPNRPANQPNQPKRPNQPNQPNQPKRPNQPNQPKRPNQPNQPNQPKRPNQPNQPNRPPRSPNQLKTPN